MRCSRHSWNAQAALRALVAASGHSFVSMHIFRGHRCSSHAYCRDCYKLGGHVTCMPACVLARWCTAVQLTIFCVSRKLWQPPGMKMACREHARILPYQQVMNLSHASLQELSSPSMCLDQVPNSPIMPFASEHCQSKASQSWACLQTS